MKRIDIDKEKSLDGLNITLDLLLSIKGKMRIKFLLFCLTQQILIISNYYIFIKGNNENSYIGIILDIILCLIIIIRLIFYVQRITIVNTMLSYVDDISKILDINDNNIISISVDANFDIDYTNKVLSAIIGVNSYNIIDDENKDIKNDIKKNFINVLSNNEDTSKCENMTCDYDVKHFKNMFKIHNPNKNIAEFSKEALIDFAETHGYTINMEKVSLEKLIDLVIAENKKGDL